MESESVENPDNSVEVSPVACVNAPLRRTNTRSVKARSPWKLRICFILDHWSWSVGMTALTIYALFGDDMRLAVTTMDSDDGFFAMSCVCLFFFALEIVLASMAKDKYLFGFYFWLDMLSTVSLITDIGWLWNVIIGAQGVGIQTAKTSQVLRAGRASRAGTRAARIIRVIRVIRLIRIVKLYKIAQETRHELAREVASGRLQRSVVCFRGTEGIANVMGVMHVAEQEIIEDDVEIVSFTFEERGVDGGRSSEEMSNLATGLPSINDGGKLTKEPSSALLPSITEDLDIELANPATVEESKVGRQLSDQISKRTIILVLGMMFILPLFTKSLYVEDDTSFLYGLRVINRFIGGLQENMDQAWSSYIDEHISIGTPIIYLEVAGLRSWSGDVNYLDLRMDEQNIVQFAGERYNLSAVFNQREHSQIMAAMSIAKTFFITFVLAISSMLFSKDANEMVIGPIESMVEKVKRISRNPLEAAQIANKESVVLQRVSKKRVNKDSLMETAMLEKIIEKIGALLAIGFGEAGSEIIVANMKKGGGEVDPMIPGRKIECVFGFCDIRNFTDTTEILQEDVMQFVNEIASIVHQTVYHFSGAPNKNIGDAFLLVWKLSSSINSETMDLSLLSERHNSRQITDMAVMSFMKIWAQIHRNPKILKYRKHAELNSRLPNYSVNMGYGLHAGWAIEGAIGSEFKIDASYLSPHVNMASRLEAATKQYGVPILVSGKIYQLATAKTREILRQIDRVTVKGSKSPIDLFTPDLDIRSLKPDQPPLNSEEKDKKSQRLAMMEARDGLKKAITKDKKLVSFLYEEDPDFMEMLKGDMKEFREKWRGAFERYIKGMWPEARVMLLEAQKLLGRPDGPTNTLLSVLSETDNKAPANWLGFRELTEK